jgi:sulfate permease, SulP family
MRLFLFFIMPMFLDKFKLPSLNKLTPNIKAGVTVSLISIPLSISLAVASGGTPLQGILTAIWACVISWFIWWSNYNIFWPAWALTALLMAFYTSTSDVYSLPILAIVVGIWSLIIWWLRLTKYITLIPSTALHGFIAWVSLTIAFGQLTNVFGLYGLAKHESVIVNIMEVIRNIGSSNWVAFGVFVIGFIFLQVWKRVVTSIPGPIPLAALGIVLWRMISNGIINRDIATLATKFPNLAFSLGEFGWFDSLSAHYRDFSFWQQLGINGFMIAAIAILETMISGKIADKITNTKFDQQQETLWVAAANVVTGLFGWLPTTAVLIRTALNVKSGANSWISAVISWVSVLIISWLGFDYFQMIPMAIIAAILINIAVWLLDFKHYRHIYDFDHFDGIVLAIVALVTFVTDPIYGILWWVSISLLSHLKRSMQGQMYVTIFKDNTFFKKTLLTKYVDGDQAGNMIVIKFGSEITFLSVSSIEQTLSWIKSDHVIIFSFSHVDYIDLDGVDAIEDLMKMLDNRWVSYHFCWLSKQIKSKMMHIEWYQSLVAQSKVHYASAEAIHKLNTP